MPTRGVCRMELNVSFSAFFCDTCLHICLKLASFLALQLTHCCSSRCRQYGHQQKLDLIPLMMEKDYDPKGWLGMILGCVCCALSVLLERSRQT